MDSIKFSRDATGKTGSGLSPQVNDLVIIHSKDPRLQWKRAIVKEILPSKDGQPRVCKVQTTSGLTTRAIKDLYPLEMQAEDLQTKRLLRRPRH